MYENAVKGPTFSERNQKSLLFALFLKCLIATSEKSFAVL